MVTLSILFLSYLMSLGLSIVTYNSGRFVRYCTGKGGGVCWLGTSMVTLQTDLQGYSSSREVSGTRS
jgi:hypothetical protein